MELLIVVVILAILSVVAIPSMRNGRTEAVGSSLAASVQQVTMVLEVQHQKTPDGSWPAAIDPAWFNSQTIPRHPDQLAGVPSVHTVNVPNQKHPRTKIIVAGSPGAFWYNAANGVFRARVKSLASVAETLEFYNLVNQSDLDSLGTGSEAVPPGGGAEIR